MRLILGTFKTVSIGWKTIVWWWVDANALIVRGTESHDFVHGQFDYRFFLKVNLQVVIVWESVSGKAVAEKFSLAAALGGCETLLWRDHCKYRASTAKLKSSRLAWCSVNTREVWANCSREVETSWSRVVLWPCEQGRSLEKWIYWSAASPSSSPPPGAGGLCLFWALCGKGCLTALSRNLPTAPAGGRRVESREV